MRGGEGCSHEMNQNELRKPKEQASADHRKSQLAEKNQSRR